MEATEISSLETGDWEPKYARDAFRRNQATYIPCSNICNEYLKLSVFAAPVSVADHFEKFGKLNQAPCPIIYQSRPGEVSAPPLAKDSNIRTDKQLYALYSDGELVDVYTDLLHIPWDHMVTFYIGCSYSFEYMLTKAGVPVRHVIAGRNVPTYRTSIDCKPVGIFKGKLLVTMRAIPRDLVQKAVEVTAVMERNHGAPIHIGDPEMIGIQDIFSDFVGVDGPTVEEGDILVFWACSVTTKEVWIPAKYPGLSLSTCKTTHGSLFITDQTVEEFNRANPPEFGSLKPRVIFLSQSPVFASIFSDRTLSQIAQLETPLGEGTLICRESQIAQHETPLGEGTFTCQEHSPELLKHALLLSHSNAVIIDTYFVFDQRTSLHSAHVMPVLTLIKGLVALGKPVILYVQVGYEEVWRKTIEKTGHSGVMNKLVMIHTKSDEITGSHTARQTIDHLSGRSHDVMQLTMAVQFGEKGILIGNPVFGSNARRALVFDSLKPNLPLCYGRALSQALYFLYSCPIHSRYVRNGIGEQETMALEDFVIVD